jgi:hypothetical protein
VAQMSILTFLRKITRNVADHYPELRDANTWDDHVAAGLRLELKCCPVCSGQFKEHRFARFASIRIGQGSPSADGFLDSLERQDWKEVIKYQGGEKTPDNAEPCVIACPRGGLALLLVHTPFEPWEYASIDFRELLKPEEGESLKKLIREDLWMPLEKSS